MHIGLVLDLKTEMLPEEVYMIASETRRIHRSLSFRIKGKQRTLDLLVHQNELDSEAHWIFGTSGFSFHSL